MLTVAEFAAQRSGRQDEAIEELRPFVSKALDSYGEENWWRPLLARTRALFNDVLREDTGGEVRADPRAWRKLSVNLSQTLPLTGEPDDYTAQTIAVYLSTAAINAAATSAAAHEPEPVLMEWVTMHDDKVRAEHKDTSGQQRPPGEPFDVDGVPMAYPGDTSAPIDLWINCRCVVAPAHATQEAALAASVTEPPHTGRIVAALPTRDLPGPEVKHLTLLYLGDAEENPNLDMGLVADAVAAVATRLSEFAASVTEVGNLGDEGAKVWMLDEDYPSRIRQALLDQDILADAVGAVEQHPHFTPHVTIGYNLDYQPDPQLVADAEGLDQINFDRLALWDGENRTEYPLGGAMPESEPNDLPIEPLAWHGVIAPEGVWSGDGRMFKEGALRVRDLPLPLTWQKVSDDGHKGSVTIGRIDSVERVEGMMRGEGVLLSTPEADEAVGLLAEFGRFGVSVDADDATFEFGEDDDRVTFTSARIASASMVAIPAFAEAFIALGTWADSEAPMPPSDNLDVCDPDSPNYDADVCAQQQAEQPPDEQYDALGIAEFVSDKPWSDFSQSDYTDDQWYSACVLHKNGQSKVKSDNGLPIKEPGGALNRNGVHAAAARFNQVQASPEAKASAARALRGAYSTLGEDPPDAIKATGMAEAFGRGPGWITNPEDTRRIHDYWTKPGHKGYAEIGWGRPGDFNRCRVLVGEKIAKNSPSKTRFLNQICAQWHHDALGFWPGRAPSEQTSIMPGMNGDPAPALGLVASVAEPPPGEWFEDPHLATLTPLTVTDDGQVFGHLCGWETCHVGYEDTCVAPPHSHSGYAYFLTGEMVTTTGRVPVGQLTVGGGHAGPNLKMRAAMAHYDSTSTAVADVTCGEDEHGVWMAGAVRPSATPDQVVALRAAAPSGDWRWVGNSPEMELMAAHSVNVPGFPVPRVQVGIAAGAQVSLVAAGRVETSVTEPVSALDLEALADLLAAAMENRAKRREKMAALSARVGGGQ